MQRRNTYNNNKRLNKYQFGIIYADATMEMYEGNFYNLISALVATLTAIERPTSDIVEIQVLSRDFDGENQTTIHRAA